MEPSRHHSVKFESELWAAVACSSTHRRSWADWCNPPNRVTLYGLDCFHGWSFGQCRCAAAWTGAAVSRALAGRGQTAVNPLVACVLSLTSSCRRQMFGWCWPSDEGSRRQGHFAWFIRVDEAFSQVGRLAGVLDGATVVSDASSPLSVPGSILGA